MGTTQEGKVKHTMICSFSSFFFLLFFQPNSFNEHTQLISASCFPLLILCFLCVSILSSILKRQIYFHFHSFDATILFFISVYSYIDDLLLHPCVCVCVYLQAQNQRCHTGANSRVKATVAPMTFTSSNFPSSSSVGPPPARIPRLSLALPSSNSGGRSVPGPTPPEEHVTTP